MEIYKIYEPYLYSIKYDDQELNEYDRLLDLWSDVSYVFSFLNDNKELLQHPVWHNYSALQTATQRVLDEALLLERRVIAAAQNADNNTLPDFDSLFKYLNGEFAELAVHVPMKAYGSQQSPSFLRMYAIKFEPNCYLVTGGGIKLAGKISDSPDLRNHVIQNINKVRNFLNDNYIDSSNDLNDESL